MKIRADEHVSPKIVEAIRDIALSEDHAISSVIEVHDDGASDVHWITKFASEGGEAILTADKDFIRRDAQVNAIFNTGLRVILLPKKWGNSSGAMQAAFMLQWWKRIEVALEDMKPRECLTPRWNISQTGEIKKVTLPFQKAHKALKKINKASNQNKAK